jgi:hypothetical protein
VSDPIRQRREERLLDELLLGEAPDPQLMARYADDPAALSAVERSEIESYLASSPRARDELQVLRGFDARAVARAEARAASGARSWFRRGLRLAVPLAVAAAALVALLVGQPWKRTGPGAGPGAPPQQVARAPEPVPPEPVAPAPAPQEPTRPAEPEPTRAAPAPVTPEPPQSQPAPSAVEEPVYVALLEPEYAPPWDLESRTRVASEVRGAGDLPSLHALAPAHVAQTLAARPTLLWHLSSVPDTGEWRLVIADPQAIDPLVSRLLPRPARPGVQRVELDADLAPGVEYQWSIVWRRDPGNPASDVIAQGWVRRVSAPAGLHAELVSRPAHEHAALYAREGLWYDALAELDRVHRRFPDEPGPRQALSALLADADLGELELAEW